MSYPPATAAVRLEVKGESPIRYKCTKILKSVLRPASVPAVGLRTVSQMNLLLRKCRNRLAQRRWVHICVLTN
ncbi:hypothetical protein FDW81_07510 [Pseudarthrobacter sp. NamB4]|nr:hypothetical protein FDW81_07510 [Pseudarthrobacter sp. NamB4]